MIPDQAIHHSRHTAVNVQTIQLPVSSTGNPTISTGSLQIRGVEAAKGGHLPIFLASRLGHAVQDNPASCVEKPVCKQAPRGPNRIYRMHG